MPADIIALTSDTITMLVCSHAMLMETGAKNVCNFTRPADTVTLCIETFTMPADTQA